MKAPPEDLAERSRALFAELGSQRRLSERTGVSLSLVSRLALGRATPTTEKLPGARVHRGRSPA